METWRLLEMSEVNERLVPDCTTCVMCGAPVGHYIAGQDVERHAYNHVAIFPTAPDLLFCEDCAHATDGDEYELATLWQDGASIYLTREADGMFCSSVATYGPDHGMLWEKELPPRYTLGGAIAFARLEIRSWS